MVIKRPRAGSRSTVPKEVQKVVPCYALLTPLLSFYRYDKKVEHKVGPNMVEQETQDRGRSFSNYAMSFIDINIMIFQPRCGGSMGFIHIDRMLNE